MRRLLAELYFLSCAFMVLGGVLIGRLTAPRTPHAVGVSGGASDSLTAEAPGVDAALVARGASLFRTHCASCHARDMRTPLTGPALGGVTERWAAYPAEDLRAWIRNNAALTASGHPRAVEVSAWAAGQMPAFVSLGDAEIDALLVYVESVE